MHAVTPAGVGKLASFTAVSSVTTLPTTRDGQPCKRIMVCVDNTDCLFIFGSSGDSITNQQGIHLNSNGTSVGVFNCAGQSHIVGTIRNGASNNDVRLIPLEDS